MEVKLIPMTFACFVAFILAQANIAVIFTGGVGKNGSTVAVRMLHYQPVVVFRKNHYVVLIDYYFIN